MASDNYRLRRISRKVRTEMGPKGRGFSGWSVKSSGPEAGYVAKDAYMVSLPKHQVEEPISDTPSTKEMRAYQEKHKEALAQPGAYHGGWIPEPGKGVQDVSIRYGRENPESIRNAAMDAIMHEQQGIGIINKKGGYAGTINMPKHLSETQFLGGYPTRTTVTPNADIDKHGREVVEIMPSAGEMLETGADWVVENKEKLMDDSAADYRWQHNPITYGGLWRNKKS